jgi:hypothetical protein
VIRITGVKVRNDPLPLLQDAADRRIYSRRRGYLSGLDGLSGAFKAVFGWSRGVKV